MRDVSRLWGTVVGLVLAASVAGCWKKEQKAGAPKGGVISGKVLQEDGTPIAIQGAKIQLSIHGVSSKSGEKVRYSPVIKPDGTYEQKVVDGVYAFDGARVTVPFDGQFFNFDLEPVGDDRADRDSAPGIVQNYVWKVKGLRPGKDADESNFTKWYGASVGLHFDFYRDDIKKPVTRGPEGTRYLFTLTPQGNMIDGKPGKELIFTREMDPLLTGLKIANLPDIPLGNYAIKGEEVLPDGTKRPLLMKTKYPNYGPSTVVKFAPGSSAGAWPCNISFTRQE